ncbi:hypothetical protein N8K70_03975 [Microbacterium betulae]|uniref:Phage tail protein n=1 Tax=Microbacterium betulae TaxID=2981139 RepID=A0AA97I6H1_9MICO|nr:hypothetical protein [Microbacterium sp. AB]WOF23849.1 hypothetical protein N8K70_03975 [Microbacterium sp. AB]
MTAISARVLQGLGSGFRRNAGHLLPPLVTALTAPTAPADDLTTTTPAGWAAMFDLDAGNPAWLAQLVGIPADPTLTAQQQRDVIRDRGAWWGGTYQALLAAIRTVLTGEKRVEVAERDPDPWHVGIRVYESDYGPGVTADTIRALAERHRPVGITFEYTFYPPRSYQESEDVAGTYADAEVLAGTYRAAEE